MDTAAFGMLRHRVSRFLLLKLVLTLLFFTAARKRKEYDWIATESLHCIHILVVFSALRRFGRQLASQTLAFGVGTRSLWHGDSCSWLWSVDHTDSVRVRRRSVAAEPDAKRIVLSWCHLWLNLVRAFASHHAWCGRGWLQISHLVFDASYAFGADRLSVNWCDWRLSRRAVVDHFRPLCAWLTIILSPRLLLRRGSGCMGVWNSSKKFACEWTHLSVSFSWVNS